MLIIKIFLKLTVTFYISDTGKSRVVFCLTPPPPASLLMVFGLTPPSLLRTAWFLNGPLFFFQDGSNFKRMSKTEEKGGVNRFFSYKTKYV